MPEISKIMRIWIVVSIVWIVGWAIYSKGRSITFDYPGDWTLITLIIYGPLIAGWATWWISKGK